MNRHSVEYPVAGTDLTEFWGAQRSGVILEMLRTAEQFALSDLAIRIVGEEGTGKLQLARFIHRRSPRSGEPLLRFDCSSAGGDAETDGWIFGGPAGTGAGADAGGEDRTGLLERAEHGTLYLDGWDRLSAPVRSHLYRAMESGHYRRSGESDDRTLGARIVLGINIPAGPRAQTNGADRLSLGPPAPVSIKVPPLRERREDIASLIYLFLGPNGGKIGDPVTGITAEALEICRHYSWPGNVYELRNVVRHSAARAGTHAVRPEHLPEYLRSEPTAGAATLVGANAVRR